NAPQPPLPLRHRRLRPSSGRCVLVRSAQRHRRTPPGEQPPRLPTATAAGFGDTNPAAEDQRPEDLERAHAPGPGNGRHGRRSQASRRTRRYTLGPPARTRLRLLGHARPVEQRILRAPPRVSPALGTARAVELTGLAVASRYARPERRSRAHH